MFIFQIYIIKLFNVLSISVLKFYLNWSEMILYKIDKSQKYPLIVYYLFYCMIYRLTLRYKSLNFIKHNKAYYFSIYLLIYNNYLYKLWETHK